MYVPEASRNAVSSPAAGWHTHTRPGKGRSDRRGEGPEQVQLSPQEGPPEGCVLDGQGRTRASAHLKTVAFRTKGRSAWTLKFKNRYFLLDMRNASLRRDSCILKSPFHFIILSMEITDSKRVAAGAARHRQKRTHAGPTSFTCWCRERENRRTGKSFISGDYDEVSYLAYWINNIKFSLKATVSIFLNSIDWLLCVQKGLRRCLQEAKLWCHQKGAVTLEPWLTVRESWSGLEVPGQVLRVPWCFIIRSVE